MFADSLPSNGYMSQDENKHIKYEAVLNISLIYLQTSVNVLIWVSYGNNCNSHWSKTRWNNLISELARIRCSRRWSSGMWRSLIWQMFYLRFGGAYYIYHHVIWRWKKHIPPKHQLSRLYGITFQNTAPLPYFFVKDLFIFHVLHRRMFQLTFICIF